tara:strand:+ start:10805 stop:11116 length:312 start_codon:yes stop_codon:yes gene_type:complete
MNLWFEKSIMTSQSTNEETLAMLGFNTMTGLGRELMDQAISGILSGVLMIIGGLSVYFQGTGKLPVSRNSQRQATWLVNVGPIFKIGGPIMIVGGFFKLFLSF